MAFTTENEIVEVLYRISSLDSNTEDPQEALQLILSEILQQLHCSSASIALKNPDTGNLNIEAHQGLPDKAHDLSMPIRHGITGWVALHGSPLIVNDVRKDARYVRLREDVRSEMAVPMEVRGSIIGVVNVDSESQGAFSDKDLQLLTLMTREASRVVNRLWLIRKLRQQTQQLESLIKTGQSLVSQRDLSRILNGLLRETRRIMQCRVCALYLLCDDGQRLELEALSDIHGSIDYRETIQLDESSLGITVTRRKQIEVSNLARTEEHHFVPLIQRLPLVSMLSTPITYGDQIIGTLNAYTEQEHRFNDDEKKLLSALASLGAVAIENARLYSRVFASEETLRKSERLSTLGLMAAEIAHEIRNPLTVIKLLFDSLGLDFAEEDPRREDVAIIREKVQQLEAIIERVLSFGKTRESEFQTHDVRTLIEDTFALVRLKLEQCRIALHYDGQDQPIHVEADKAQLQQALLNLLINSVQAMPEGGEISVVLDWIAYPDSTQTWAFIEVSDTGGGIEEEIKAKIFESFLSDKADGTGLGLAITKRIMRSHHGDIELTQSSGEGSTFKLWLPLVDGGDQQDSRQ